MKCACISHALYGGKYIHKCKNFEFTLLIINTFALHWCICGGVTVSYFCAIKTWPALGLHSLQLGLMPFCVLPPILCCPVMRSIYCFLLCLGLLLSMQHCSHLPSAVPAPVPTLSAQSVVHNGTRLCGLTLVAPPQPFATDPMMAVKAVNANWIAVVPYAFTRPGQAAVNFNHARQWWGERVEGVRATIEQAHAAGLQVMLKPQVWIPRNWTGTLDFSTDAEWETWERDYTAYLMQYADIAEAQQVGLLCIGTEFRRAVERRPQFWKNLIAQVRQRYHGKLVYSANWDDWDQFPFWADLDYIGLGGYFPLIDAPTPSVDSLQQAWQPIRARLAAFSAQQKRPVLFTEYGYLSVDGCGGRNWELEKGIESRTINEQAQANCIEALLRTFQSETWWAGGFLWKWFPNGHGHEGYPERDYTPQGKLAEKTLTKWYGQSRSIEWKDK